MLALAFGIPEGVGSGWLAMLGPNMQAHHFSQDDAGWVGFAMTVAGCIAGICAGQILDIPSLARQKKSMVIILFILCTSALHAGLLHGGWCTPRRPLHERVADLFLILTRAQY